ncbi:MAG: hypothetical protein E4H38_03655 [Gemmatimonadales bacterium]|jgi:hypothetical protein|nr:MAG: hypothetical protein E4H38_03655 [Gemmatimonadales bacterium]
MKPLFPIPSDAPDEADTAIRVADALADAVGHGPVVALRTARGMSDSELRLGLDFVSTVLEVASSSARAMAKVLAERGSRDSTHLPN